jgi:hypothetical protein
VDARSVVGLTIDDGDFLLGLAGEADAIAGQLAACQRALELDRQAAAAPSS